MGATLSYLEREEKQVSETNLWLDSHFSTYCMLAGVSLVLTQMSTLTNSCPQLCFSCSSFNLKLIKVLLNPFGSLTSG